MKLVAYTLLLDGMPWLPVQHDTLSIVNCDFEWFIVHGAAMNNGSTSWCQPQIPRFSKDESIDYLRSVLPKAKFKSTISERESWDSKDAMVNEVTTNIKEPCVLLELDVDEIYQPSAVDRIVALFDSDPTLGAIRMRCRFWVGRDLLCMGDNCWSNQPYEWNRAFRFQPGMKAVSHEPPKFDRILGRIMDKDESSSHGLTFDHMSYVTEAQVKFKQDFYGYDGLLSQWKALQAHKDFPVPLSRFFSHVSGDLPLVVKI